MSSLSVKNLKNYVVLGIAVAAAYIFFQKDQIFLYRLIDGLFIGGMLPMILGCFRLPAPLICWSTPTKSWRARGKTPILHRMKRIPMVLPLLLPNSSGPIPTI